MTIYDIIKVIIIYIKYLLSVCFICLLIIEY